ncbi:hypothetical protein M5689_006746 [Euphorbia peplus]|nr:hypothetical protein M5689_006746 [Euphorbia peplus]
MGKGRKVVDKTELRLPAEMNKMVQSLKEILNTTDCTDTEIYSVLQECQMNPDEAVQRLLAQDKFHEVKSRRERRKEMKEAQESKARGSNISAAVVGVESNVGLAPFQDSHNEFGKAANMREPENHIAPSVASSLSVSNAMITMNEQPSCDRQIVGAGGMISSSEQISGGSQPAFIGGSHPSGYSSLADVVRLGRPRDSVSHLVEESSYTVNDTDSVLHVEEFSRKPQSEEVQVSTYDFTCDNQCSNFAESDCLFTGQESTNEVEGGSRYTDGPLEDIGFRNLLRDENEHLDVDTALGLEQLSLDLQKMEVAPQSKDTCKVVLPKCIQALDPDCSHLSFGTYNSRVNTDIHRNPRSDPVTSDLEEPSAIRKGNTGFVASLYGEMSGSMSDTVRLTTATEKNRQLPVSSQPGLLRPNIHDSRGYSSNNSKLSPDSIFKNTETCSSPLPAVISPPYREFHPSHGELILDSGDFALPKALSPTLPNAESHVIPQHLSTHSYSPPAVDPEQLNYYNTDPQIYPRASSSLQQPYQDNSFFHESLAGMKPNLQNLERIASRSSLPLPYAKDSGHAKFSTSMLDDFSTIPNQSAMGYNDLLGARYNEANKANNLAMRQQNDNNSSWDYGLGPRTSPTVPDDIYYNRLGQGQSLSTYQPGTYQPGTYQPGIRDNRYYNLHGQGEQLSAYQQAVPDNNRYLSLQRQNQLLSMYQQGVPDDRYNRQVVDRLIPLSQQGLPSNRYHNLQAQSQQLTQNYATLRSRDAYAALHPPQETSPALPRSLDDVLQASAHGSSKQLPLNWQNFY